MMASRDILCRVGRRSRLNERKSAQRGKFVADTQLKGVCLLSVYRFLREAGILESTLAKLEEPHATALSGVVSAGWYPQDSFVVLLEKIHEDPRYRDPEAFYRLGRRVVNEGLNSFYKALAMLVSPAVAVKRAPRLWGMYTQNSTMTIVTSSKGHASGYIVKSGRTIRILCRFLMGGFAEPIHLAGGKNVVVTHPRCRLEGHEHCFFEMRWDE